MDMPAKKRGRPRGSAQEPAGTVQALERGVQLLQILAKDGDANLSDLALRAGMPPSTAHRLLATLQNHALVELDAARQTWGIGVEAFRIGNAFTKRSSLVERAREVMHTLVDATGETANLAQEDAGEITVLAQADTPNPVRAFFRAGTRVPMHASGIGKALLAQKTRSEIERILQKQGLADFTPTTLASPDKLFEDLEQIKKRGWSFDDQERYEGMRCIAAPIFNQHGEAIAGISVSGPAARFTEDSVPMMAVEVKRAAFEVTAQTGGVVP